MANILAISSQVVRGAIGNSIASFALQRMGHVVWQIPTIVLSNHPGHGTFAGKPTSIGELENLWEGFKAHGWHRNVDAVLTGYMPDGPLAAYVGTIVKEVQQARPDVKYLCDPIIGDTPGGIYIDESAAHGIRDNLVPLANVVTPNLFELGWLVGSPSPASLVSAAIAAEQVACPNVVATSVPGQTPDSIENLLLTPERGFACGTAMEVDPPKGTGDLFSAATLGHWLQTDDLAQAVARATAIVRSVLRASAGQDTLQVVTAQDTWMNVDATAMRKLAT